MDRGRWAMIQAILARALEADPEELQAMLAEECGDDIDLRLEVESLLAASDGANEDFGELADRAGIGALEEESDARTAEPFEGTDELDLTGRRVATYRLVRLFGSGGMTTVYLAERADGQFEHRVALKLLPLGTAASRSVHRRVLAERGILTCLEHPNIARLLDGGALDDGTPYFVMECVDRRDFHRQRFEDRKPETNKRRSSYACLFEECNLGRHDRLRSRGIGLGRGGSRPAPDPIGA